MQPPDGCVPTIGSSELESPGCRVEYSLRARRPSEDAIRSYGMRALSLLIVFAACSKPKPPTIAQLIVEDATAISAWRPTDFAVLTMLDTPPEMLECWRALEQKLQIAYQVFVPSGSSYVILDGDLPRQRVESCASEALLYSNLLAGDISHDGDLTVVPTRAGTVYVTWRGRRVVLGRRSDVLHAVAPRESAPPWLRAEDLPEQTALATTAFVAVSADATFGNLLGVPTTRWKLVMESPRKPWAERRLVKDGADALDQFAEEQMRIAERKAKGLPVEEPARSPAAETRPAWFRGHLELTYPQPADANRAAAALAKGAFAIPLEANLASALAKLPQTISGATLVVRFDQTSFPGVELDKLQAWGASLQPAP